MAAFGLVTALVVALGVAMFTAGPPCQAAAVRRRGHTPPNDACLAYLSTYGYCSLCGVVPIVGTIPIQPTRSPSNPCNATQIAQAIAKFQKTYRILPITAECDEKTLQAMTSPRCGVADDQLIEVLDSSPPSSSVGLPVSSASDLGNGSAAANATATRPQLAETGRRVVRKRRAAAAAAAVAAAGARAARAAASEAAPREAPDRRRQSLGLGAAAAVAQAAAAAPAAANGATNRTVFETEADRQQRYWDDIRQQYVGGGGGGGSSDDDVASAASSAAGARRRRKRGTVINSGSFAFSKTSLKWRIISYSGALAAADQNAAMDGAFRQWAAVTPLCFANDQVSDVSTIDILLGFYAGSHPGDSVAFNGPGGALAHSYMGQFTHFDSTESWYTGTTVQTGVALSAVALHEFGHVIGLPHSSASTAIMYSLYSSASPNTLLTNDDRSAALAKYGPCSGSFDAAVDVQFNVLTYDDLGNPVTTRYFSSYFFRNSYNWLYMNSLNRPADYEPQLVSSYWSGVPNQVDAAFQYSGGGVDQLFFLKGSTVYLYSYSATPIGVTASYAISTFFPAGSSGQPIPNNIDSAYFDPRDLNIYFFKSSLVYAYHYNPAGGHSCCVSIRNISDAYPIAAGQPATVSGVTYQQNIDMVYQSVNNNSLYFFVGNQVWKDQNFNSSASVVNNSVVYLGTWNSYWNYICDVVC